MSTAFCLRGPGRAGRRGRRVKTLEGVGPIAGSHILGGARGLVVPAAAAWVSAAAAAPALALACMLRRPAARPPARLQEEVAGGCAV